MPVTTQRAWSEVGRSVSDAGDQTGTNQRSHHKKLVNAFSTKMARTSPHADRPSKKARTEPSVQKPRARFAEPEPVREKLSKKKEVGLVTKDKGKAKETNPPAIDSSEEELPATFKVIAGSYEKLLYGVEGRTTYSEDKNIQFHLKAVFAFPAHVSCIKAIAASPQGGKWLASGSADEIIKVWDLRRRKEIGGLMHHEGVSLSHMLLIGN